MLLFVLLVKSGYDLFIPQVIGSAAQELSKPTDLQDVRQKQTPAKIQNYSTLPQSSPNPESWRDVIQKRIESKTRRFGQGRSKPEPVPVQNKFTTVAGYFFYPLMKNFDRSVAKHVLIDKSRLCMSINNNNNMLHDNHVFK